MAVLLALNLLAVVFALNLLDVFPALNCSAVVFAPNQLPVVLVVFAVECLAFLSVIATLRKCRTEHASLV